MTANMASLREQRTIAEVCRLSNAGLPAPELLQRVARALHRVVPFELYSAATIDPASSLITYAFAGSVAGGAETTRPANHTWFERFYFEEAFDQTIALVRRGESVTTILDETNGRLESSLCYRESMKPAGIEHKAHALFVDRELWGDMELYRERGSPAFSPRELEFMRRIAPEVGKGLRVATLRARGAGDGAHDSSPGVLVIDHLGRITGTPTAERMLAELGELHPRWREKGAMPAPVHVVLGALQQTLAPSSDNERGLTPRLRVRGRLGRWLSVHAAMSEATPLRSAERIVVIAPAKPQDVAWLGMSAYDLSTREEEVVKLVVGGLSTRSIADKLFISENTVQRHLSNIFDKVGVRGRRALVKQLFFEQVLPAAA